MTSIIERGTDIRPAEGAGSRPRVAGKFLSVAGETFYVRGVTYGTFRPNEDGDQFPPRATVAGDFTAMAQAGINTVRTYTVPPLWLLDLARERGLRVMIGLPWEQHIAFLDDRPRPAAIESRMRAQVRAVAGHGAILCYAIGNEIPASIVRWHGARRIERFLHRLYRAVKAEDPEALVTYVNFPSTEYLDLDFVDFMCFNVYLEHQDRLEEYLARLQVLAGDRPLVLAEIGLDSRRHGDTRQATVLDWQIRTSFAAGCAGLFLFAWTDEWYRGGYEIEDWDFGLVDRVRRPKPALTAVREAFTDTPFPAAMNWPRISVVVCSHNGARTIADCCEGLLRLDYPDYEVIVIDDGSTDGTAEIVRRYGLRVVSTENRGLSAARNAGLELATGQIVAYTDDDARPDPQWLRYLALTYAQGEWAGVGGPNITPAGDGTIAECIANAPGGPVHVLLTDRVAEHIPGCNMSFRRDVLRAIGGFDPRYRAAGDDVDICWRVQEAGGAIGFSPAAMVWHHRRNSVRTYWKQQRGYGKAEALLEGKWPERYNAAGHITWSGRLYGRGLTLPLPWGHGRIYGGSGGTAPFQSIYQPAPGLYRSLPLMPEWFLIVPPVAILAALGFSWRPLFLFLPVLVLLLLLPVIQAGRSAAHAVFPTQAIPVITIFRLRLLVAVLHLMQPLARLRGRLHHGLTPWRCRPSGYAIPRAGVIIGWREQWKSAEQSLSDLEAAARRRGSIVYRGGTFDCWDLAIRGGLFAHARLALAIEEHGSGKQLLRLRVWPVFGRFPIALSVVLAAAAVLAVILGGAVPAAAVLAAGALLLVAGMLLDAARATAGARVAAEALSR